MERGTTMLIDDATFVVTDTETTGLHPGPHRVIEIGAVKVENGLITERFNHLVNPGVGVPGAVVRLTGITTAMVSNAPRAVEILPAYVDFLGSGIFVGHNAAFDRKFLQWELRRASIDFRIAGTLCTKRLSRRILHALPSKSLGSLMRHYRISARRRHRALDDAQATAEIFIRLVRALRNETGIDTVEELLRFQYSRHDRHRSMPANVRRIRSDHLGILPEVPGVYFLKDNAGTLLYVGKARNIRARVRSYFVGIDTHPLRIRRLVRSVRDIDFIPTPSELSALILESRLIKAHRPKYNRAQVRYRNLPFIRINRQGTDRSISWSYEIHPDGASYYGPLKDRTEAELMVSIASRYPALFETDLEEIRRLLAQQMYDAAERLDFEKARVLRDQVAYLDGFAARPYRAGYSVLDHNAIWVDRTETSDDCTILGIRQGRLAADVTIPIPATPEGLVEVRKTVAKSLAKPPEESLPYRRREIDEIRIIAGWIYRQRERLEMVPIETRDEEQAVFDRVAALVT